MPENGIYDKVIEKIDKEKNILGFVKAEFAKELINDGVKNLDNKLKRVKYLAGPEFEKQKADVNRKR
jgi:DNA-binding MltR family transcriptional regulator